MSKTAVKLLSTMDAQVWAKEFIKIIKKHPNIPLDEETMIGWFANAIMCGYDHAMGRHVMGSGGGE